MSQYIFKGIVHPERAPVSVGPIKPARIVHPDTRKELVMELNIVFNQITVWVEAGDDWNIVDLRNIARYFASTVCSVLSFVHGYFFEVEIVQAVCRERNIDQVFGIDTPCIAERPSAEYFKAKFTDVLKRTGGIHGLYYGRCFKDLNLALKDTEDTAFYCYRAIESLRKLCGIRFGLENDSAQWNKLWMITGFDRTYVEKINKDANETRHGDIVGAKEADRIHYLTRTWNIVEKFIENEPQENDNI